MAMKRTLYIISKDFPCNYGAHIERRKINANYSSENWIVCAGDDKILIIIQYEVTVNQNKEHIERATKFRAHIGHDVFYCCCTELFFLSLLITMCQLV